jgi:hypothetical protein
MSTLLESWASKVGQGCIDESEDPLRELPCDYCDIAPPSEIKRNECYKGRNKPGCPFEHDDCQLAVNNYDRAKLNYAQKLFDGSMRAVVAEALKRGLSIEQIKSGIDEFNEDFVSILPETLIGKRKEQL